MNSQIEKKKTNPPTIRDAIQKMAPEFARVLPKYITSDRMVRIATTQLMRVPKLARCTQQSLLSALMTCAELGIEPDGRKAHLIPYDNKRNGKVYTECNLLIDYKGYVDIAMRHPDIEDIYSVAVYGKDVFKISQGSNPTITHELCLEADRGKIIGAYAIARLANGLFKFDWMPVSDIEKTRKKSKAKTGPWHTDYDEMCRKTPLRRLFKYLPTSDMLSMAMEADDRTERGESQQHDAIDVEVVLDTPDTEAKPLDDVLPDVKTKKQPEPEATPEQPEQDNPDELIGDSEAYKAIHESFMELNQKDKEALKKKYNFNLITDLKMFNISDAADLLQKIVQVRNQSKKGGDK